MEMSKCVFQGRGRGVLECRPSLLLMFPLGRVCPVASPSSPRDSMVSVLWQAIIYAVAQSMIFFTYAAGFRFGAFLVIEGRADYDNIFR